MKRGTSVFVAAAAFAAFLGLGSAVDRYGEPAALLAFDHATVNHAALAAWWITQLGRAYVLVPIAVALLIAAWRLPAWRGRILFTLLVLVLCWRAADFFQHLFARPRRLDWVIHRETSFSFPSSHAAITIGFYAVWAWLIARSGIAWCVRAAVVGALALVMLAIYWSRLALGAHYVTDLAGGLLLGLTLAAAAAAVWPEIELGARKERT